MYVFLICFTKYILTTCKHVYRKNLFNLTTLTSLHTL